MVRRGNFPEGKLRGYLPCQRRSARTGGRPAARILREADAMS
jgi:hypothetical protein